MGRYLFLAVAATLTLMTSCRGNPKVVIETSMGDIEAELYQEEAPATVANFLFYVDNGLYDNSCFYRVVRDDNQLNDSIRIAVIQGGRYNEETDTIAPVVHERTDVTGIRHLDGTISMARWHPGTATSEFFITVGDQPALDAGGMRNRDGQGFAAFGRITGGMEVVRKIHAINAPRQYLADTIPIRRIYRK
ncbi:MAG: peptidylprolyl isomerase [Bacteroidales bacterium]|jgi:peptidyl-prolyl cis-trans isomerase A (cyclophilin A)|nr:peptidylprolyl isomerase [Bacteroidales bacterium]